MIFSTKSNAEMENIMGGFLAEFVWESVKYIFLAAVALGGIVAGKKLRDRHDSKSELTEKK